MDLTKTYSKELTIQQSKNPYLYSNDNADGDISKWPWWLKCTRNISIRPLHKVNNKSNRTR